MIPRNPFFIGNTEKIDNESSFLSLFNSKAISYIKADDIHHTVFFRSTPGAGKSSVFRLFTPAALKELVHSNNTNYDQTREFLEQMSAIEKGKVNILGIKISCASNYSVIDDIYDNGKRSQVFFALLNLRILREVLLSSLEINNVPLESLHKLQFASISSDVAVSINPEWTGKEIYNWTIEEENRICRAMDEIDDPGITNLSINSLAFINLIRGNNILFDNKEFVMHTLLMLDDLQYLTRRQRNELREDVFKQKVPIGIWIAERLSILSEEEIVGTVGSHRRDYLIHNVEYENGMDKSTDSLQDIANRRVNILYNDTIGGFSSCVEDLYEDDKILNVIGDLEKEIFGNPENSPLKNIVEKNSSRNYDKAVFLRALKILIDRKLSDQQMSLLARNTITFDSVEEGEKKIKSLKHAAEFYMCIENKLPYYYGNQKLCSLSFNNIEQYLEFCGAVFERRIAKSYSAKRRNTPMVSPVEQEKIIKKIAEEKWNAIERQYTNSDDIYTLLKKICALGEMSRNRALASYGGGAFTGIGFNTKFFTSKELNKPQNERLLKALSDSVASNYLCKRKISQGKTGEEWSVFYLNRWICALNNLPLGYGGWKPISKADYPKLLDKTAVLSESNEVFPMEDVYVE